MNIHLVNDEKFINKSFNTFEKYYPKDNIFFVDVSTSTYEGLKYTKTKDRIIPVSFFEESDIQLISSYCKNKSKLFIHHMDPIKAYFALQLKREQNVLLYWIFYGAELYTLLEKKHKHTLQDYHLSSNYQVSFPGSIMRKWKSIYLRIRLGRFDLSKLREEFIYKADFFCFWNHYDYQLLQKYYNTDLEFKYFRYFDSPVQDAMDVTFEKNNSCVLVNHSASRFGNHLTILKKLRSIDNEKELQKVIVPMGYGDEEVKKQILEYGQENLGYCIDFILKFVSKKEYFNKITPVGTALFGNRRQQGAGSIFYLLATGTKIFLRRDNNMLSYLRDRGFTVFEFEKDLNSINDLSQLDKKDQIKNRRLIQEEFSKEAMDEVYENL